MKPLPPAAHKFSRTTACLAALALVSCSKSITVKADFPQPLVEALPLTVALQYSKKLTDYHYTESLPDDATWSFDLGEANVRLFDSVFHSLFERTLRIAELEELEQLQDPIDALIAPSIEAFEFSLPRQARSDQFSVWIRYNLDVYGPDGQLITSWPISAYGQKRLKNVRRR